MPTAIQTRSRQNSTATAKFSSQQLSIKSPSTPSTVPPRKLDDLLLQLEEFESQLDDIHVSSSPQSPPVSPLQTEPEPDLNEREKVATPPKPNVVAVSVTIPNPHLRNAQMSQAIGDTPAGILSPNVIEEHLENVSRLRSKFESAKPPLSPIQQPKTVKMMKFPVPVPISVPKQVMLQSDSESEISPEPPVKVNVKSLKSMFESVSPIHYKLMSVSNEPTFIDNEDGYDSDEPPPPPPPPRLQAYVSYDLDAPSMDTLNFNTGSVNTSLNNLSVNTSLNNLSVNTSLNNLAVNSHTSSYSPNSPVSPTVSFVVHNECKPKLTTQAVPTQPPLSEFYETLVRQADVALSRKPSRADLHSMCTDNKPPKTIDIQDQTEPVQPLCKIDQDFNITFMDLLKQLDYEPESLQGPTHKESKPMNLGPFFSPDSKQWLESGPPTLPAPVTVSPMIPQPQKNNQQDMAWEGVDMDQINDLAALLFSDNDQFDIDLTIPSMQKQVKSASTLFQEPVSTNSVNDKPAILPSNPSQMEMNSERNSRRESKASSNMEPIKPILNASESLPDQDQHRKRTNTNVSQATHNQGQKLSPTELAERMRHVEESRTAHAAQLAAESTGMDEDPRVTAALMKLAAAQVRKLTIRVYINDLSAFKTIEITTVMAAGVIAEQVAERALNTGMLPYSPVVSNDRPGAGTISGTTKTGSSMWTLFEVFADAGIERPLRDWERVHDVLRGWERDTKNVVLLRRYGYKSSLTVDALKVFYPGVHDWLHIEVKPGSFKRKFFELRLGIEQTIDAAVCANNALAIENQVAGLYMSNSPDKPAVLLCSLANFDVYTPINAPRKRAPTKYGFALKSQQRMSLFEDPNDGFVFYLYTVSMEKMKEWVLAMRNAKAHIDRVLRPEWLVPFEELPMDGYVKPIADHIVIPPRSSSHSPSINDPLTSESSVPQATLQENQLKSLPATNNEADSKSLPHLAQNKNEPQYSMKTLAPVHTAEYATSTNTPPTIAKSMPNMPTHQYTAPRAPQQAISNELGPKVDGHETTSHSNISQYATLSATKGNNPILYSSKAGSTIGTKSIEKTQLVPDSSMSSIPHYTTQTEASAQPNRKANPNLQGMTRSGSSINELTQPQVNLKQSPFQTQQLKSMIVPSVPGETLMERIDNSRAHLTAAVAQTRKAPGSKGALIDIIPDGLGRQ